jgi:LPS export ABC transporter protein LptC/lipopolysaccharide transport protein LptA
MSLWQRKARMTIAVAASALAIAVAFAFQRRVDVPVSAIPDADPEALVETAGGLTLRVNRDKEEVRIAYNELRAYADGRTLLSGVKVTTERAGGRTFTMTAKQAEVGKDESTYALEGDVHLTSSDGLTFRTSRATYIDAEGLVRAPEAVEFSRGRMRGSGLGLTYDEKRDVITILERVAVYVDPGREGGAPLTLSSGSLELERAERVMRFAGSLRALRGAETIQADAGTAYLAGDNDRLERLELRGNSRITGAPEAPGALQAMTGRDMDLKYGIDGETLERAVITGGASVSLAGELAAAPRRVSAETIDVTLAGPGGAPTAVSARGSVELALPASAASPARTIGAETFEASGEPGKGLTGARFDGSVRFHETGAGYTRDAVSRSLRVAMQPGLGSIDEATFAGGARFTDGEMTGTAAEARYGIKQGTLQLSGTEPGAPRPAVRNDEISVDAARIDVTLEGPRVHASGAVKSVRSPEKASAAKPQEARRTPSMFRQNQAVSVTADELRYDGSTSTAVYSGNAQLWQGETTIKAATITLDDRNGDLSASGSPVATTTILQQTGKDGRKERTQAVAKASEFRYEEALRRATYAGDAVVNGPQGDVSAAKIELYLKPSGDELERAEAYDGVTLGEQRRKTSGNRLTYFSGEERYIVTGTPLTVVDECGRETVGRTLTFFRAADTIVVDGNEQMRTRTQGGGKCP